MLFLRLMSVLHACRLLCRCWGIQWWSGGGWVNKKWKKMNNFDGIYWHFYQQIIRWKCERGTSWEEISDCMDLFRKSTSVKLHLITNSLVKSSIKHLLGVRVKVCCSVPPNNWSSWGRAWPHGQGCKLFHFSIEGPLEAWTLLQHCLDLTLHKCFFGTDEKILTEFSLLYDGRKEQKVE